MKKPNLDFLPARLDEKGIFHDACQGGVGKYEPSFPPSRELVGEQAERICISFKVGKVFPLRGCQLFFQGHSFSFGEKVEMARSPECPKGGFPKSCARQAAETMEPISVR